MDFGLLIFVVGAAILIYELAKATPAAAASVPDATAAPADVPAIVDPSGIVTMASPVDISPSGPTLEQSGANALAQAWADSEGYYPGSRAYVNNNPGNLKYNAALTQPGYVENNATGQDAGGFAIFPDEASGFDALTRELNVMAGKGYSILQAASAYLGGDPNKPQVTGEGDPFAKAQTIASKLGVTIDTKLSQLFGG